MSENVCYVDSYARSVEARVVSVDPADSSLVILDTTVFYPGGSRPTRASSCGGPTDAAGW